MRASSARPTRQAGEAISAIAAGIGCHAVVLDDDLIITHRSPDAPPLALEELAGVIAAADPSGAVAAPAAVAVGDVQAAAAIARVALIDGRNATILLLGRTRGLAGLDPVALETAVTAISVELLREEATEQHEARLADGLFQLLLADRPGSEMLISRSAASLGVALAGDNALVAVSPSSDSGHAARSTATLRRRLRRVLRDTSDAPAALFEHHDALFALLTNVDGDDALRRLASTIAAELSASDESMATRIAFAGPHRGVPGARRAAAECRHALQVLRATAGSGPPTGFNDLGIWTILASADRDHLVRFREAVLGPVIEYDERRQSQLVQTLRTLVGTNFQGRPASCSLEVHPNTIAYRTSVIAKLTGLDLSTYEDQVKADIALRITDMLAPL